MSFPQLNYLIKSSQAATWIWEVIIPMLLMEKAKPMDEKEDSEKKKTHLNQDLMVTKGSPEPWVSKGLGHVQWKWTDTQVYN